MTNLLNREKMDELERAMFPKYDVKYSEVLYSIEVVEQFILDFNIPISIKTMEDLKSIEKYCKDLLKEVLKGRTTE